MFEKYNNKKVQDEKIFGITSTIPIEIPLAAGYKIIDLNNAFINSSDPLFFIKRAESDGYPRNCCAWIKGIYGYISTFKIQNVIFVIGGDCSNTHAMKDTLHDIVKNEITFSYPDKPNVNKMKSELVNFAEKFNITIEDAENFSSKLIKIRQKLYELDRLTYEENKILGVENFEWLINSTDFMGDYISFEHKLSVFLDSASKRNPINSKLRLGIIGVPPIIKDLIAFIEQLDAHVVYNEIPRQFAMLSSTPFAKLSERYTNYSYPYGIYTRLNDINAEICKRDIHGIIHYTQSFCHRQIHDVVFRKKIKIPILTIEGENPCLIDARTKLRIESFIEMLKKQVK